MAKESGFKGFILPEDNAKEAAVVKGLDVYGVKNIRDVADFFLMVKRSLFAPKWISRVSF